MRLCTVRTPRQWMKLEIFRLRLPHTAWLSSDLLVAIQDHFSRRFSDGGDNPSKDFHSFSYRPSEANAVIERFSALPETDKQAILDFLRSL